MVCDASGGSKSKENGPFHRNMWPGIMARLWQAKWGKACMQGFSVKNFGFQQKDKADLQTFGEESGIPVPQSSAYDWCYNSCSTYTISFTM